jgi:uncharacterized protein YecE (DUF72 family)
MRIHVGTSGFAYKEWRGSFYPEKMREKDMLRYYAERLSAVEVNNTFYRMPAPETLARWAEQVPEAFTFVLKASQRITHRLRLAPQAGETVGLLFETARSLGGHLGPVFFQTPPLFRKDMGRLSAFLGFLPARHRVAFEFRHESWLCDEVYDALRGHNAALVAVDHEEARDEGGTVIPTADWGYLRLRRRDYGDEALDAWRRRITAQAWREAFVFFKHEEGAPLGWPAIERFARSVGSILSRSGGEQA